MTPEGHGAHLVDPPMLNTLSAANIHGTYVHQSALCRIPQSLGWLRVYLCLQWNGLLSLSVVPN